MSGLFIAGTDTDVGKTCVCGLLGRFFSEKGLKVATQKWVQTGSSFLFSDLAEHHRLMKRSKKELDPFLSHLMPYCFSLPASPHLAARCERKEIDPEKILKSYRDLSSNFECCVVEGSGGVLVPYSENGFLIDLVQKLKLPVLLVAKNRLGVINHTLLSLEALKKRGIRVIGILFNGEGKKEEAFIFRDNVKIVATLSKERVFGPMPWCKNSEKLYSFFKPIGEEIWKSWKRVLKT